MDDETIKDLEEKEGYFAYQGGARKFFKKTGWYTVLQSSYETSSYGRYSGINYSVKHVDEVRELVDRILSEIPR